MRQPYGLEKLTGICFHCGVCCSRYQARLDLDEAQQLAAQMGIPREQWIEQYTDPKWPGKNSFLIKHIDGACIFLKRSPDGKEALCSIHAIKPAVCRSWHSELRNLECQEGLEKNWGLSIYPPGRIDGPQDKLEEFYRFLESLGFDQSTR
jgi:Fe-S-cluster containining protein